MQEISLVYPHQLYEHNPALSKARKVLVIEDELYFRQYRFHQQKILLHRASMKYYQDRLRNEGFEVEYIDASDLRSRTDELFKQLSLQNARAIHYTETSDYLLERRLRRYAALYSIRLQRYASPAFVCSMDYVQDYFSKKKRYFLNDFYIDQRKRLNVLLFNGEPLGGKWTYDSENRKKMPAGMFVPPVPSFPENRFVSDAKKYVAHHFNDHYGNTDHFKWPVTHAEASYALDRFLEERFLHFGIYQDAMVPGQSYLFHSMISSSLNIGLLGPMEVIQRSLDHAFQNNIPLNSLEGFIRQVLGWREYVRAIYEREGVKERTTNFWNFERQIPPSFWTGETGIEPLDIVIRRLLKTGYNHHIERLMLLGNFMCLCGFHPDEVYRWFMEMYIDSYDWVMVPNVYGMSQYADGGLMSTKPYISGSNYILKMSGFKKGPWCDTWVHCSGDSCRCTAISS